MVLLESVETESEGLVGITKDNEKFLLGKPIPKVIIKNYSHRNLTTKQMAELTMNTLENLAKKDEVFYYQLPREGDIGFEGVIL